MTWTTVILIVIAVVALLVVLGFIAWLTIARAALKNFNRVSKQMDDDFNRHPRI